MIPRRRIRATVGSLETGEGFSVDNLVINFEVIKHAGGSLNTATVSVVNLSNARRQLVQDQYTKVILDYSNGTTGYTTLFIGEVYNAIVTKENGTDIVTTLYCGSGLQAHNKATMQQTFPGGTTPQELIQSVASNLSEFGITLGNLPEDIDRPTSDRAVAFSGSIRRILDNILAGTGLTYSFENETLEILSNQTDTVSDIVITPGNGLIESANRTQVGFDFQCVLNPLLVPGLTIGVFSDFTASTQQQLNFARLDTAETGGYVRVQKVTHKGTNHTGKATSDVIGIR